MSSSGVQRFTPSSGLVLQECEQFPIVDKVEVLDNNKPQLARAEAGNGPNDHYKSKLSPLRYKIRSYFLPWIRKETELLAYVQASLRNPFLDIYFAWTANLASHTFYVLMLPLPMWFGASTMGRHLVCVLGLGIFFTGHFKDYLCLPRPRSPPLHRITMSSYTTQEYGFPLSHSANATAVTLVLFMTVMTSDYTLMVRWSLYFIFTLYYVSLIFGRIYCGMHGFLDVFFGSLIGCCVFLFRAYLGPLCDEWLFLSKSGLSLISTPLIIISGYLLLIHFHAEPVDDCPCFDDSVAFIGVLIGLDISQWMFYFTDHLLNQNNHGDPLLIPFNYTELGPLKTLLRVVIGVGLVATWKAVSKPIIFTILPPIYKVIGVYLPRRNFEATAFTEKTTRQIRSQSLSNMNEQEHGTEFHGFINKNEIGPENDIDIYEILAYEEEKKKKGQQSNKASSPDVEPETTISGVFRPRYDVEIVGRLIVYAGVAFMAQWGFALSTEFLGLNCRDL